MRLSSVLMVYFIMGATLWGGGVVDYGQAGVVEMVITSVSSGQITTNTNTSDQVGDMGGPLEQAVNTIAGGAILSAWGFISGTINYMFWPVSFLVVVNAPPEVVVLLGGAQSFAFVLGVLAVFRRGS